MFLNLPIRLKVTDSIFNYTHNKKDNQVSNMLS